jgi:hypothetical protein
MIRPDSISGEGFWSPDGMTTGCSQVPFTLSACPKDSEDIIDLTSCSKRCKRASTCSLASVRNPETRFRSLACGEKMQSVFRAKQLLHGTLRSHLSLALLVSTFHVDLLRWHGGLTFAAGTASTTARLALHSSRIGLQLPLGVM